MADQATEEPRSRKATKPKRFDEGVKPHAGMLWRQWRVEETNDEGQPTSRIERFMLTDCLIDVLCAHEIEDRFCLEVQLTRPDKSIRSAILDAGVLEDAKKMNAWATSTALCNWNLEYDDRKALKAYLMEQPGTARRVQVPPFTGYQPAHGVFLCGGTSIDYDGWLRPETHRDVFSLKCRDGKTREFRINSEATPRPIIRQIPQGLLEGHYSDVGPDAQKIGRDEALYTARRDLNEFCELLRANFGRHCGALALGWTVANMFYDDVFHSERSFPHLYLYGAKGSGKDTLAYLMADMAGVGHMGAIPATKGTTAKGIRDAADLVSGHMLWLNELRKNDDTSISFMSQIRAMFDGQSGTTSSIKRGKPEVYKVRRGLMLGGQDILGSDAEYSRYVLLKMRFKDIHHNLWAAVKAKSAAAHRAYITLMAHRPRAAKTFLDVVEAFKKQIDTATITKDFETRPLVTSSRQRFCWAVSLAGIAWATCEPNTDHILKALPDGVWAEAVTRMDDAIMSANEDGTAGTFWGAIESGVATGAIRNSENERWLRLQERPDPEKGGKKIVLAIWLGHLVRWHNHYEKQANQISMSMLRAELEELPSFLDRRAVSMYDRSDEGQCWRNTRDAWVFDINLRPSGLPSWLIEYALGANRREPNSDEPGAPPPQTEAF